MPRKKSFLKKKTSLKKELDVYQILADFESGMSLKQIAKKHNTTENILKTRIFGSD